MLVEAQVVSNSTSLSQSLQNLASSIIGAIPSIILFIIIVIIGWIIAKIVSSAIRRVLTRVFTHSHIQLSADLVAGTVYALIVLITLSVAFSVLNFGAASVYMQKIANYLPSLAGAILLLTLGVTLVNLLVDYMMRQLSASTDPFMNTIFSVLRFGLYAVIITVAATLAIFYWIPFISPYLFYDIIIASVVLLFGFTIVDKAMESLSKDPNAQTLVTYGRFILYTVFLVIAIAIITQPFGSVQGILQSVSWGLAIGFALMIVPLVYALAKKIAQEIK